MEDDALQGRQQLSHRTVAAEAGVTVAALARELAGAAGAVCVARGGAWLEGRRVLEPEQVIGPGQTLTLRLPPEGGYRDLELSATDIAYADRWLVALHKPAGCYVGATPWDVQGNLLAALGRYLAKWEGSTPQLHLAHQLDRDTSGVLLFSRDPAVNPALQAAFATGLVQKRYLALCAGVPIWEMIGLRTGHGRAAGGRWRLYEVEAIGRELPAGGGRVKEARTDFVVERRLAGAALVQAELHTGRTHQIRLHLAQLGHPLLGDQRYSGPSAYQGRVLDGHLLHAATLALDHPATGARLTLSSPLPERFTALLG